MVITRSDYDSGRLSPLDREAYVLGLLEQPNGNYSLPKFKLSNTVATIENPVLRAYIVNPPSTKWCDASERISKRELGVDWRGWERNKSRRG